MSTVVALVHTSHTCVHRSKIIIDVLSFIYIIYKMSHVVQHVCVHDVCHVCIIYMLYRRYVVHRRGCIHSCMVHHTDECILCTYILYCTRTSLECWTRYAYMMCMFPVYLHTHPLGRRSEKEEENSGLIISRVFSFTLFQMFQMLQMKSYLCTLQRIFEYLYMHVRIHT